MCMGLLLSEVIEDMAKEDYWKEKKKQCKTEEIVDILTKYPCIEEITIYDLNEDSRRWEIVKSITYTGQEIDFLIVNIPLYRYEGVRGTEWIIYSMNKMMKWVFELEDSLLKGGD